MQKKMDNSKVIKLAVIGASLAGVAATAYFFFGPKGKKHREHAKTWAIKIISTLSQIRYSGASK